MQVEDIKTLIYKMLTSASIAVDYSFLVGGFGNSPYLWQCMREALSNKTAPLHKLHTCGNGGAAVMKGKSKCLQLFVIQRVLRVIVVVLVFLSQSLQLRMN